jgi:hypothetical protein
MPKCVNCGRHFKNMSIYEKDTCSEKCLRAYYYGKRKGGWHHRPEAIQATKEAIQKHHDKVRMYKDW